VHASVNELPPRRAPLLTEVNRHFWTGGAKGELRFTHCDACGLYLHPPAWTCRRCHSDEVSVRAVSGRGTLLSYTVNHQPWIPELSIPYVIGLVELEEQEGLRLTTNIIGCPPDQLSIGMALEVRFEPADSVHVPVFTPAV
jgi:uncharacterized OB-fold protein